MHCYFMASLRLKWNFWTKRTYTRMYCQIDFVKLEWSGMFKI